MNIRKAGNSGRFYPSKSAQIIKMIDEWEDFLKNSEYSIKNENKYKIAIVPHAGYIYSGFTAYCSLKKLQTYKFDKLVVVGPSHHVHIHGFSIAENEEFETPFGNLKNDNEMVDKIESLFDVDYSSNAHYLEHSTENQFPLIKYLFPDIKIIEIIYGNISTKTLTDLFSFILNSKNTGLVISTDLSHFHTLSQAIKIDNNCIEALQQLNPDLLQQCEACGKPGLLAILNYCMDNVYNIEIVDYRTSAEMSGDTTRVVGYLGAVILNK